jgi:hypothetical protein
MSLVGGLRKNIRDYDFKYTTDNTRKNWIKSIYPHIETLVNIAANIPYSGCNEYNGSIVYTYFGEIKEDEPNDDVRGKLIEIKTKPIKNYTFTLDKNNSVNYNFFGGICFELLNDAYPNVNLYDFVDPTSDIDIDISTIISDSPDKTREAYSELNQKYIGKENSEFNEIEKKVNLVVDKTLEEPELEPYLNPYFRYVSDFIFEQMLIQLNQSELNFENSVPFDIDEYKEIVPEVKDERLGYMVNNIENSNAKLVRYLDQDFGYLRIQIILKVVVNDEIIIDHLLEFLFHKVKSDNDNYTKQTITIPEKENWRISPPEEKIMGRPRSTRNMIKGEIIGPLEEKIERPINTRSILQGQRINISSLYTLIDDNLEAYKKREVESETEGPRRHKPINHITRIIYLLDLIKNNSNVYDSLDPMAKGSIRLSITKQIVPSYVYYKVKNDEFTINRIDTINIVYAFYTLFVKLMQIEDIYLFNLLRPRITGIVIPKITKNEEQNYYNSLMSLFGMNASPFRKIKPNQEILAEEAFKEEYEGDFSDGKDKIIMSTGRPPNYGGRKTHRRKHRKTHRKKDKKTHKRHRKRTRRHRR